MKALCLKCNQEYLLGFVCFSCGTPPNEQFRILNHEGYEEGWTAFLPNPEKEARLIEAGEED